MYTAPAILTYVNDGQALPKPQRGVVTQRPRAYEQNIRSKIRLKGNGEVKDFKFKMADAAKGRMF